MERLEAKKINGHTYYYLSRWAWVEGRCRRTWQKYLGKLENFSQALLGKPPPLAYAEVLDFGLPVAFWQQAQAANVLQVIDALCPKRNQGLSTAVYLTLAAVNRAVDPVSKMGMWDWLAHTSLSRRVPGASARALRSQRFWDHLDALDETKLLALWKTIIAGVIQSHAIDLSAVCYDGTNFYTFIDTFNTDCTLARRGKNKQGRANLRQISYALFCSARDCIPLYYEVYEGNRPDAVEFPRMLEQFHKFLQSLGPAQIPPPKTILIFDKGNNSLANFTLLDRLGLSFVGSVKLDEHPELAQVSQEDRRWQNCTTERLENTKAFALRRQVYGKERTVVVTFNQNLFDTQLATVQADLTKAWSKLKTLQSRLSDRASGQIKRGSAPTNASIGKQCTAICARPYLDRLVVWEISSDAANAVVLTYRLDEAAMQQVQQTLLGKTILITDQTQWSCEQVIQAYRSQFVIEDIFKGMKDRKLGSWWPLYHWTDQKIRAHGFYCTVAVLLRSLLWRRVRAAGIPASAQQLWSELAQIREVVNVYGTETQPCTQRILSRGSELQQALIRLLDLKVQPEKEESTASQLKAEN